MTGLPEYIHYDGLGLAELVHRKEVTPQEVLEEAVVHIERSNPRLNAVVQRMYDRAREDLRALPEDAVFLGVPFLLKDLIVDYAGVPTSRSSSFHQQIVPDHDSELVKRYKAAGLVILGKTNLPEYAVLPITEPELYGPTHNPWDPARTPGGSSGGSAVAVAARMVPLAHATDGAGSIRQPASLCGLFGLKPTRGRNPLGPDLGEYWQGFAVDHVLTRSVRDSAATLDATAGPDVGAPYYATSPEGSYLQDVATPPRSLRIAYTPELPSPSQLHPDVRKALAATVQLCRELGHEVIEATLPLDTAAFMEAYMDVLCGGVAADIAEAEAQVGRRASPRDFEVSTLSLALYGRALRAPDFVRALRYLQRCARRVGAFFEDYDVWLGPTVPAPAIEEGQVSVSDFDTLTVNVMSYLRLGSRLRSFLKSKLARHQTSLREIGVYTALLPLFNVTGQPAMSVPLHWSEAGLPIGMHFAARYGDESTLFRLAGQLERACPWANRVPPVHSQGISGGQIPVPA